MPAPRIKANAPTPMAQPGTLGDGAGKGVGAGALAAAFAARARAFRSASACLAAAAVVIPVVASADPAEMAAVITDGSTVP